MIIIVNEYKYKLQSIQLVQMSSYTYKITSYFYYKSCQYLLFRSVKLFHFYYTWTSCGYNYPFFSVFIFFTEIATFYSEILFFTFMVKLHHHNRVALTKIICINYRCCGKAVQGI